MPRIHDDPAPATFAPAVPHDHDNDAPVGSFLASVPDTLPSSVDAPVRVNENVSDALPLDKNLSVPVSLHPVDQTTTASRRIPASLPNPVTTCATHGSIDTSARTPHLSTPEPLASTSAPRSRAQTSPPDTSAVEHTVDAPFDDPDVSLSPSTTPVLDNTFPIGLSFSSDSPVAGSDHAPSPVSHSSMLAPAAPFEPPSPSTSSPEHGVAAENRE